MKMDEAKRILTQAAKLSGNRGINLLQASKIMAERGDAEAQKMLDSFCSPETRKTITDIDAAVEAHPGWCWVKGQEGAFEHIDGCPEDTPDKLLTWYRQRAVQ